MVAEQSNVESKPDLPEELPQGKSNPFGFAGFGQKNTPPPQNPYPQLPKPPSAYSDYDSWSQTESPASEPTTWEEIRRKATSDRST